MDIQELKQITAYWKSCQGVENGFYNSIFASLVKSGAVLSTLFSISFISGKAQSLDYRH